MRLLKNSRWTKCTGLLVMLTLIVVALTAHAIPAKASVICGGGDTKGTTNYYSDASKTVLVGRYTWNDCTATESLTGQQTQYATSFISCC